MQKPSVALHRDARRKARFSARFISRTASLKWRHVRPPWMAEVQKLPGANFCRPPWMAEVQISQEQEICPVPP
jgi:hypothetical protein